MDKQITIVVGVVKNAQGQILVTKRIDPMVPSANNKWDLIGGKIEFAEDLINAIAREIKEESGLTVKVISLLPKIFEMTWKTSDKNNLHTLIIPYLCEVIGGELNQIMDHKISELKFLAKDEIKQLDTMPLVNPIIDIS